MMESVISLVMGTHGGVTYSDAMNMQVNEFFAACKTVAIIQSAERSEQNKIDNHERALNGFR